MSSLTAPPASLPPPPLLLLLRKVETRRRNMPLAGQRRGDLYELVDKGR